MVKKFLNIHETPYCQVSEQIVKMVKKVGAPYKTILIGNPYCHGNRKMDPCHVRWKTLFPSHIDGKPYPADPIT
uniref:Uncharacterized protein n=1 Tax=Romanomermis culicivorax TaxID=13658 RepID=A0A915KRA2_ROMCU